MKFNINENQFFTESRRFNMIQLFICFFLLNLICSNSNMRFENSTKLINFDYYHRTEVIFFNFSRLLMMK